MEACYNTFRHFPGIENLNYDVLPGSTKKKAAASQVGCVPGKQSVIMAAPVVMQLSASKYLKGPRQQPVDAWDGALMSYDASREHPFHGEMHEWRYWHEVDIAQEEFVEYVEQPTGPNYVRTAMRLYVGKYVGGAIICVFRMLFSVFVLMIMSVNNVNSRSFFAHLA